MHFSPLSQPSLTNDRASYIPPSPLARLLAAALIAGATGCTTLKLPDSAQHTATRHAQTSEQRGLRVTVDPWADRAQTVRCFGVDARGAGIAIVSVTIENLSPDASYLLLKENLQFARADAPDTAVNQGGKTRTEAAGAAVATTGAAVVLIVPIAAPVLMFTGAKMASDASVVRQNLSAQELQNTSLAPGQSVRGCLYFQLKKGEPWGNGSSLRLTLKNTRTQAPVTFRFPFNFDQP